jgi:hypothetical protein
MMRFGTKFPPPESACRRADAQRRAFLYPFVVEPQGSLFLPDGKYVMQGQGRFPTAAEGAVLLGGRFLGLEEGWCA